MAQAPPATRSAVDGRFQLGQPLVGWGFGEAWRARDGNFRNRAVVVKLLGPEALDGDGPSAAFVTAVKAARTLRHPQLLALVHSGLHDGRPYVVYESLEGTSLAQHLEDTARSGAPLDLAQVERIVDLACAGLGAAHEAPQPVVHGGVHPGTFVLRQGDAGVELKAIDLGLWPFAPTATREALRVWTAPERLRAGPSADPAPAEDVFALGMLTVELLLAHLDPARRDTARATAAREGASRALRLRDDVPDGVWEVLDQSLRHNPGTRFEHASALRDALHSAWRTRASHTPREVGARTSGGGPPDLSRLSAPMPVPMPTPGPAPSAWGGGWNGPAAAAAPASAAVVPPVPSPWGAPSPLALPPLPAAAAAPVAAVAPPSLGGLPPARIDDPWRPSSGDWASPSADDNPWDVPHQQLSVPTGPRQQAPHAMPSEPPRDPTRALDLDALYAAGLDVSPSSFAHNAPSEQTRALDLDALQAPSGQLGPIPRAEPTADTALPDDTPPDGIVLPEEDDPDGPLPTLTPSAFRPPPVSDDEDWRDAVMMLDTAAMARSVPSTPMAATTKPPTRAPGAVRPGERYDDEGATSVQSRSAALDVPDAFSLHRTTPMPGRAAPRRPATMQAPTVPRHPQPPTHAEDAAETLKPMPRGSVLPAEAIAPAQHAVPANDLFATPPPSSHSAHATGTGNPFGPPMAAPLPTGTMPLPRHSLPMEYAPQDYTQRPLPGMPGYVPPPAVVHQPPPAPPTSQGKIALVGVVLVVLVLAGLALTLR